MELETAAETPTGVLYNALPAKTVEGRVELDDILVRATLVAGQLNESHKDTEDWEDCEDILRGARAMEGLHDASTSAPKEGQQCADRLTN